MVSMHQMSQVRMKIGERENEEGLASEVKPQKDKTGEIAPSRKSSGRMAKEVLLV